DAPACAAPTAQRRLARLPRAPPAPGSARPTRARSPRHRTPRPRAEGLTPHADASPHLFHRRLRDLTCAQAALAQNLADLVGLRRKLFGALPDRQKLGNDSLVELLLAVDTADPGGAAPLRRPAHDLLGRELAVQGEDVADLGRPRIGPLHARGIRHG